VKLLDNFVVLFEDVSNLRMRRLQNRLQSEQHPGSFCPRPNGVQGLQGVGVFPVGLEEILVGIPCQADSHDGVKGLFLGFNKVPCSLMVLVGYQWVCFGSPFYPAQHYMPPAEWSHLGYQGMDWPQLDLLWDTAFGMHFGLFTSAPLLLLALYIPGWFHSSTSFLGSREKWFVVFFCMAFLLFCSMNQYGRMQFNSGVRHVVPVTPFIFLLASEVLLRMPRIAAVLVGIVATYWSWCLAMYRDVEQDLGVFESIIQISFEGLRLPWLKTLEAMGYVSSSALMFPLLLLCAAVIWVLCSINKPLLLLETGKPSK